MCVLTILGPVRRPWRSRGKGESRAAVQPASFSFPSAAWWTGAIGTRVVYLDFSKRLLLKRRQNAGRPQGAPTAVGGRVRVRRSPAKRTCEQRGVGPARAHAGRNVGGRAAARPPEHAASVSEGLSSRGLLTDDKGVIPLSPVNCPRKCGEPPSTCHPPGFSSAPFIAEMQLKHLFRSTSRHCVRPQPLRGSPENRAVM